MASLDNSTAPAHATGTASKRARGHSAMVSLPSSAASTFRPPSPPLSLPSRSSSRCPPQAAGAGRRMDYEPGNSSVGSRRSRRALCGTSDGLLRTAEEGEGTGEGGGEIARSLTAKEKKKKKEKSPNCGPPLRLPSRSNTCADRTRSMVLWLRRRCQCDVTVRERARDGAVRLAERRAEISWDSSLAWAGPEADMTLVPPATPSRVSARRAGSSPALSLARQFSRSAQRMTALLPAPSRNNRVAEGEQRSCTSGTERRPLRPRACTLPRRVPCCAHPQISTTRVSPR